MNNERNESYVAQNIIGIADHLGNVMTYSGFDKPDAIERVIIRFKDLLTLYTVVRTLQAGLGVLYHEPVNRPSEFKRDEFGHIFSDVVIYGVPFRFTTLERNPMDQPVIYVEADPMTGRDDEKVKVLTTVMFDPDKQVLLDKEVW